MAKRLVPLNDYVIVVPIDPPPKGIVPDPNSDKELLQSGAVVDAGKYADSTLVTPALTPGTIVYWWRFAGSGQTIEFDGRTLAHIKYEKLLSFEEEN